MTFIKCGDAPKVVANFYAEPTEAMFYLYLPISLKGDDGWTRPRRLGRYDRLIELAKEDFGDWRNSYVYITAKSMFVTPESPGNRPGWHIDGFGSGGDINYIWADMNPTEFAVQGFNRVSSDDKQSMVDIESQILPRHVKTYSDCSVLRLDETVVHRMSINPKSGFRSFVKISISDHKFRNAGNSINYDLDYSWVMKPRSEKRNLDHG